MKSSIFLFITLLFVSANGHLVSATNNNAVQKRGFSFIRLFQKAFHFRKNAVTTNHASTYHQDIYNKIMADRARYEPYFSYIPSTLRGSWLTKQQEEDYALVRQLRMHYMIDKAEGKSHPRYAEFFSQYD